MTDDERGRRLLFVFWAVCLLAGLASAWVFVAGVLRDTHFEEAALAIDLGETGAWRGVDFRVWGGGPYVLWLTTLRPDRASAPAPSGAREPEAAGAGRRTRFRGRIEVRILEPDGDARLERRYEGRRLEHAASGRMTWTRLEDLRLDGLPVRAWRLEARVLEGDPEFGARSETRSRLLLRRDRPEVGMGGLINYVMIIPAVLFLLLSLGLAFGLARRGGSRAPAWISGFLLAALASLWAL